MPIRTCPRNVTAVVSALALLVMTGMTGPADAQAPEASTLSFACPQGFSSFGTYSDVGIGQTHAQTIGCLHAWQIMRGGTDGAFRPGANATRGQFAIALHALLDSSGSSPKAVTDVGFHDVQDGHAARGAIEALAGARIVKGTTETTFAPDRLINRAQMASLIVRSYAEVFGRSMPEGISFPDTVGTTHDANIRRLVGGGITVGFSDGNYRPGEAMTRAQMATFLTRYLDVLVTHGDAPAASVPELRQRRASDPDRTIVEDADGTWIATFTDGARSVAVAGPKRRFDEASAGNGVTSTTWVRLLPRPFDGEVDRDWLARARADRSPDVLQTSMQYLPSAPDVRDADGVLIAGEAGYGPGSDMPVGSDWHDYQSLSNVPSDQVVRQAESRRARQLDCSGYTRMIFGVRHGFALSARPDGGTSFPRRATQQANDAPGVAPVRDRGAQVTDFSRLQPGDLVFFDATPSNEIDHVGIYLGPDDAGRHRFISSRRSSDGPTMGDYKGASLLDGDGYWARAFRATRRL